MAGGDRGDDGVPRASSGRGGADRDDEAEGEDGP